MNTIPRLAPVLCSLALALHPSASAAEGDGFVPLFNGRDLSGWVNANCAPETWSVRDGMIHCTGVPTGALRTARQYENFILEAEWRHLTGGGNSGVFIWGTPIAAPGVPFLRGIEVQVLDHGYAENFEKKSGKKSASFTTHGDVFPIHGATMKPFGRHNGMRSFPSGEFSKPSPQWNHYRIVCTNGVIRLSVNGHEVSGGEDCNYRNGYLALESEGAPIDFRNIRIKELPSSGATAEMTAPVDEGFRPLYTGVDLRGWKVTPEHGAHWQAKNWTLNSDGKATGDGQFLKTDAEYENFELIVDYKLVDKKVGQPTRIAFMIKDSFGVILLAEEQGAGFPPVAGNKPPGQWNRAIFSVNKGKLTVRVNDQLRENGSPLGSLAKRGSTGLDHSGAPAQFANIYIRELK